MTTRRVIIGPGGSSPFRVSVAGVDAAGAQFNDLIFDGNQPPLRLFLNGYIAVDAISQSDSAGGVTLRIAYGPSGPVVPSGTNALFLTMWRQPNLAVGNFRYNGGNGFPITPQFASSNSTTGQGGGGTMDNSRFIALSFSRPILLPSGFWTGFPTPNYVNYCIFKNYN